MDVRDEKKVPITVPKRRIVTDEAFLKNNEIKKIRSPEISPPIKANKETGEKNLNEKFAKGKSPQRIAPKLAPEEMPNMPESAKGFLKNPWRTAPLPPRSAPHKMLNIIRGSLSSRTIIRSNSSASFLKKSIGEIFSAPRKREIKRIIKSRKSITTIPAKDFFFINNNCGKVSALKVNFKMSFRIKFSMTELIRQTRSFIFYR